MCAAEIGAGGVEFTMEPTGHRSSIGAKMPSLNGRSGAIRWASMTTNSLSMMYGFELKKWLVCGDAPSKSKTMWSPSTVSVHGIS